MRERELSRRKSGSEEGRGTEGRQTRTKVGEKKQQQKMLRKGVRGRVGARKGEER